MMSARRRWVWYRSPEGWLIAAGAVVVLVMAILMIVDSIALATGRTLPISLVVFPILLILAGIISISAFSVGVIMDHHSFLHASDNPPPGPRFK